MTRRWLASVLGLVLPVGAALASGADEAAGAAAEAEVLKYLQPLEPTAEKIADYLWKNPELGFLEFRASQKLSAWLQKSGFEVESGVAGMPTAFVASYGQGKPVIALLGEMDALPGESQDAVPEPGTVKGKVGNQACGHNLFGPGSAAAAIAIRSWLKASGQSGTIRYYGTPAEEGGAGKVYMVRDGLFGDVDIVLHWHPAGVNAAIPVTDNAVISGKFRFHGIASHAAISPMRGRSALDGIEVMNYIVNMMREHIPTTARIHYIITSGGDSPNIVPDFAEVYYYVRENSVTDLKALWQRVVNAAQAAALGTETKVDFEVLHGTYNTLINETLKKTLDKNLRERAPLISWTEDDRAFAKKIYATFENPWMPLDSETFVVPYQEMFIPGSTDVGDISWVVPTANVVTMTWVPSTDAHSWQAAAASGTGIGFKGMHLAAEVLSMTAVDLFTHPELVAAARQEFEAKRGPDFKYAPLLGDREPPLEYRLEESKGPKH